MTGNLKTGDEVTYKPKTGGEFPTGERSRIAKVEAIRGDEIIVKQLRDGFTNRISEDQITSSY